MSNHPGTLCARFLIALAVGLWGAPASAMEDDFFNSYTRAEVAAGTIVGQAGSAQSLVLDGWAGYDVRRLWWAADASRLGGKTEASTAGAWYGQYIAPFWDAQIGVGHEGSLQNATYLSAGVRGLAPYQYDTDIKFNVRTDGKVFARARFETDFLMTNRFILRPWLDTGWAASNINATVRTGLYQLGLGLQARYEFTRKLAPYLELSRTLYPRALPGGFAAETSLLAGLRLIF